LLHTIDANVAVADPLPARVGRFTIDRQLGTGGMARVWLAWDGRYSRHVALKRLPPEFKDNERSRRLFEREADRVSKLHNEHITEVYECVEQGGELFVVMELVVGVTLRERLRDPLSLDEAVRIAIECAEALAAAHTQGLVHHDIKPENIMLCHGTGMVKVCDFGVARQMPAFAGRGQATNDPDATGGTLAYMAPEVLLDQLPDGRADIFSLGVVLYEMLTRRSPFATDDKKDVAERVLSDSPPALRTSMPSAPVELGAIVGRMLAKEPAARYSSAADLLRDLLELEWVLKARDQVKTEPDVARARRLRAQGVRVPWVAAWTAITLIAPALVVPQAAWPPLPGLPVQKSLAVLRFGVSGGDVTHRAFCDGLAQAMTTRLTRLTTGRTLQVAPFAEVQARHVLTPADARHMLGANLVLTGLCERNGDRERVTYVVSDATSGRQLRADSQSDLAIASLSLQERVVDGVVRMLAITPRASSSDRPHMSVAAAYAAYLEGRGALLEYGRPDNVDKAANAFERALRLDPKFAPALAGLGEAYWRRYELTRDMRWMTAGREQCERAAELQDTLPEARVCLGDLDNRTGRSEEAVGHFRAALAAEPTNDAAYRGLGYALEQVKNLVEAERTYRQSKAVRPTYWAGYSWLAAFLVRQGRYAEAAEEYTYALSLAPENARLSRSRGAIYILLGRFEEGIADLERANTLEPTAEGFTNLGVTYFNLRMFRDSVAMLERAVRTGAPDFSTLASLGDAYYFSPDRRSDARDAYRRALAVGVRELTTNPRNGWNEIRMASVHAALGEHARALECLRKGLADAGDDNESAFFAAVTYARLGDRERAMEALERSAALGYSRADIRMRVDFDRLRSDPRFAKIVSQ